MAIQVGTHRQEGSPTLRVGIERNRWIELTDLEKKRFLEEKIAMAIDAIDCSGVIPSLWQLTWINAAIASSTAAPSRRPCANSPTPLSPIPYPTN